MRRPVAALAVLATLVSSFGGIVPTASAQSSALYGWATMESVTPGAGCWVPASVEVRDGAGTVGGVDVGVNLSYGGDVVASDWGVTDGDGLAYFSVDTTWASPGVDAWLDVVVDGAYAGGMPVSITDGGGCSDNPNIVSIGAERQSAVQAWSAAAPSSSSADGVYLNVPTYAQKRNLSCEYAAVVIAMGYYGDWESEYDFDSLVGSSENPHWGYRGNITGWWGNTDDYGVYASALRPVLGHFGFTGEEFYAQGDASALTARLDAGTPVLVWLGLWGDTSFYDYTADGTRYKLASGMHVVVADGYDSGGVRVSDPASGTQKYYDWGTFMTYWNVLDGMGLAIWPL